MKALIDGDIIQYEFGSATNSEYKPLAWPFVQARVQARIDKILEDTGADEYQIYLTSTDKSNFRFEVASIKPYKGNRPSDKPFWFDQIRDFLINHRKAIVIEGMEADDAMGIEQTKGSIRTTEEWVAGKKLNDTVICTLDKDLLMIPGNHYSWRPAKGMPEGVWYQDELRAIRCFYKQLLTGDPVDNIPGLYRVGKSSSFVEKTDSLDNELDMYNLVYDQYKLRFGSYAKQFINENAQLLWILRNNNKNEILERFERFEKEETQVP